MTAAGAQPRVSAGSGRGGQYSHKPVADDPDAAGLELGGERAAAGGSGECVLMMADSEPPTGLEPLPEFAWTPMRRNYHSRYLVWPYPASGHGQRYWAIVQENPDPGTMPDGPDYSYWNWKNRWVVVFGEVAPDFEPDVTSVFWHHMGGIWLRGDEIGRGDTDTLAEAQLMCQSAADEHHHGPEMAWWAYAERAAAPLSEREQRRYATCEPAMIEKTEVADAPLTGRV